MGEVNATIYLKEGEPEKGWGYTRWELDMEKVMDQFKKMSG